MTMPSASALAALPDALQAMRHDDDALVHAIGVAITRTVTDELDDDERRWLTAIDAVRGELDASTEEIDTALQNARGVTKPLPLGEVAVRRSKKGPWALVLLALAHELRPHRILELGTCLGISGAHLAAGANIDGSATLTTLEGAPALAARAQAVLDRLGVGPSEVVPGVFKNTLSGVLKRVGPFDLAFIDGHHDEVATQAYFDQLLPHLTDPAVVVFDDIAWSDGMERAWRALRQHPSVRVAVDLDRIGICVVGAGDGRREIGLPRLTTMAATVRSASSRAAR